MPQKAAPTAVIIGGGPAGLMAATVLGEAGSKVTLFERMPTVGRKFLMAGRGGLNLTHSEPLPKFLPRYREAQPALAPIIAAFTPEYLVAFVQSLGQETFVGTSGRVFPKTFKTSPLLRAWLARLSDLDVDIRTRHRWMGLSPSCEPQIEDAAGQVHTVPCDVLVLALGGASWPRLGSDGGWVPLLEEAGVPVQPLRPANCGFLLSWSEHVARFAGEPLKRIALTYQGETVRGEAMITKDGLEGGAVYALSAPLRDAILGEGHAELLLDLRPDLTVEALAAKLSSRAAGQSLTSHLRKAAGLAPAGMAILRESVGNALPSEPLALAKHIKAAPLRLTGLRPIEGAISTAGGVAFKALDKRLMLTSHPGIFVAGEMLDWEAPTGGYLLQACFATGAAAAKGALQWWEESRRSNAE